MTAVDSDLSKRQRFEALSQGLRDDLYRYAFWLARDPAIADDVVQETLLRAWRAFDKLKDEAAAKAWFMTILRREHARLYERKRLETVPVDELSGVEERILSTSHDPDIDDLRAAILALDEHYREPLVMQVLFGFTAEEIAAQLGLKTNAVLTRLFRARKQLRAST